jgi:hypothetical protein
MITDPKPVITSIYDKRLEIHYNEWYIRNKEDKWVKLDLQGKIKCPVLNASISSLACARVMDKEGWPRAIDENVCKKCSCFVHLSIRKFQEKGNK